MFFCDSPELVDKQIFNTSSPTLNPRENSSVYGNQKNAQKYNCTITSNNSNDPLKTIYLIKEKLKNLDKISRSENCDDNILIERNINITNSLTKTPSPLKNKKTKKIIYESPKSNHQESYFFSDDNLNLFQEIQEENEILKREKDDLEKVNYELRNTNNDLVKKQKDYDTIKSEFSMLISKFGPNNNSKSIIDIFDEKQEKLDKISDLLSLTPESDPICEISNLIQENKENTEKLKKSKLVLNYLINKYEKLAYETVNSKKEVLDLITESNKKKKNQTNNMSIIMYLAIPIMIMAIAYMMFIAFL